MKTDWVLSVPLTGDVDAATPDAQSAAIEPRVTLRGTIYDRQALAASLGIGPAALPSDASLVASAVARWGAAAVRQLRGAFALAIVEPSRRRAVVARDPLGSHPLFYTQQNGHVYFAEAPGPLLAIPGVSSDVNRAAIADHLCHRWPAPHETFYQAVRRVPPGCQAVVADGCLRIERHWDPSPPGRDIEWIRREDLGRFDALLDQAVDRCLDEAPGGVFLSGGLDSISVAAAAAERAVRTGRPAPWALSLALPDPECDERDVQNAVAAALGMRQHFMEFNDAVGPNGLLRAALRLNEGLSSPLLNIWGPAYLSLAEHARSDGVATVLTGSGGDEWLSVSPYLSADLMRAGDLAGLLTFLAGFRRSYRHPLLRHLRFGLWTFGGRPLASQVLSRVAPRAWRARRRARVTRHDPSWIAPDPSVRREQLDRAHHSLEDVDPEHGFYVREVRRGLDHFLTSWELEEQHDFGRRVGMSFRHPYWDADLVDMLYRTPPALLYQDGRAKGLVRGTLARRFPSLGLDRQRKVSATSFYRSIVSEEGAAAAAEVGSLRALADLGVVTRSAADRRVGEVLGDVNGPLHQAWELLNLETWVRLNRN